jgi:3-hydroxyisobutyrate dehydrogenase-like beta-hydroxyacid dehydrogenase
VAVIGLGNMGGRIARRLADAGVPTQGYDVVDANYGRWGFEPPESLASVLAADVVLLSLPDAKVVERAMRGPEGVFAGLRPGQVVIDLSTSDPMLTIALATEAGAGGFRFVDAGISGGAAAAERGALTIMVGSDDAGLAEIASVFEPFATKVVAMGSVGAGHAAKLLNNFLNAIALSATAEVMVAARKAGLDLDRLLEVLNASSGVNFATINRFPSIVHGNYLEGGLNSQLMMKDIRLYTEYLGQVGVPSLNASAPLAAFGLALHLGYADQISNRVVDALGDISGHVRLYDEKEN